MKFMAKRLFAIPSDRKQTSIMVKATHVLPVCILKNVGKQRISGPLASI